MTPIVFLMKRLSRLPLHERIGLLRLYLSYEKPNSIRAKELGHALKWELIKQLNREERLDHRTISPASAPIGHQKAERVSA